MIYGVNGGYTYFKTCIGRDPKDKFRFRSTARLQDSLNKGDIEVLHKGMLYTIGAVGDYTVDENKIDNPTFQLCMNTAIAMGMEKRDIQQEKKVQLVTGLPIGYYKNQHEALEKSLLNKEVSLELNHVTRNFKITDVIVYAESAGLIVTNPELFTPGTYVMVIDWGGKTIDVSLFFGQELVKYDSFPQYGMLSVYADIASTIDNEYHVRYDNLVIEDIIKTNVIHVDDQARNITNIVGDVMSGYAKRALRDIKIRFPEYRAAIKKCIGGGSIALQSWLPDKNIALDSVYSNADAFYRVGVQKFK